MAREREVVPENLGWCDPVAHLVLDFAAGIHVLYGRSRAAVCLAGSRNPRFICCARLDDVEQAVSALPVSGLRRSSWESRALRQKDPFLNLNDPSHR